MKIYYTLFNHFPLTLLKIMPQKSHVNHRLSLWDERPESKITGVKTWKCFQIPDTTWPSWKALLIFTSLGALECHCSFSNIDEYHKHSVNFVGKHILFVISCFISLITQNYFFSVYWLMIFLFCELFLHILYPDSCHNVTIEFILYLYILIAKILLVLICFLFLFELILWYFHI